MAWVKVPPENHPIFHAALPKDPRVETRKMFGGVAASVNGNVFAGLFGRSTMLLLPDADRARALSLDGAAPFDPMGDGRARSDKIMLPESMMSAPAELRRWIAKAFNAALTLPVKTKAARKPTASKSEKARPAPPSAAVRPSTTKGTKPTRTVRKKSASRK
jgi:TfoX/Sxy family transcriptional regulator of competence genes